MAKIAKNQAELEDFLIKTIELSKNKAIPGIVKHIKFNYVDSSFEKQETTIEFPVLEWELNPRRVMHGGFLNTLFDSALGLTVGAFMDENDYVVTLDIATDYIKPIPENDALIIKCKIISFGHTIIKTTAEAIIKSSGKLAATCASKFMIVKNMKNDIKLENFAINENLPK